MSIDINDCTENKVKKNSHTPNPTQNPVFAPEYVMYMFLILRNIDNDYLFVSNSIKLLFMYMYIC